jgi:hypothetical protein
MKAKRVFKCKAEELPVIGEFLVEAVRRDMAEFSGFSPVFNEAGLGEIEAKINACRETVRSWVFIKELKAVTEKLENKTNLLRVGLNKLEGYLNLAAGNLDVRVADAGLISLRKAISRGNTEGVIAGVANLLVVVRRNLPALEAKGLQAALPDEIAAQTHEIGALNVKQNELESLRNRQTEEDVEVFNDLWKSLLPVFETGRALYRGVNEAKLKDYTYTQLHKRIHSEGKRKNVIQ